MNKIILLLSIIFFVILGCACDNKEPELKVWVDKNTGVNYYMYYRMYGVGMCPKYDKNGKIVITKVNKDKD